MNHEGAKDAKILFFYLIGETDQVNHHALRAIIYHLSMLFIIRLIPSFIKMHVPVEKET
jgi:hypothetical protein